MKPLLHPRTAASLEAAAGSASGGLIFHGDRSSGKHLAAVWLAARLNCAAGGGDNCAVCRQIAAGNFPDLIMLAPEDKPSVTIDQVRRLLASLALSAYRRDGVRLVVIDEAQSLTPEAQNALLKSLEEPPEGTRFILVTDSLEALLPTVRSRLGVVYFAPVATADIAELLASSYGQTPARAATLADLADGVVGEAIILASTPDIAEHRAALDRTAAELLSAPMFTRLVAVRRLIDAKEPVADMLSLMQRQVVTAVKAGDSSDDGRRQLQALMTARKLLAAGVVPRVVLDRLSVEL